MPPATSREPSGLSCTFLATACEPSRKVSPLIVVGVLGVADGGIGGIARGILGLAVQVLHGTCGFTGAARRLGLSIASHVADGAFDLTGEILCRTGNSILIHRRLLHVSDE